MAGKNTKEKITEILRVYEELFQATSSNIQYDKTSYFSWRQILDKGVKKIINILADINIEDNPIKIEDYRDSI